MGQVFVEASFSIGSWTKFANLYDDGDDGYDGVVFGAGKLCLAQGILFQWFEEEACL